jgi:hypothetical protein
MFFSQLAAALLFSAAWAQVNLLTDISQVSRSWGQISVYEDNPEDYFGVDYVGLPDGCQIVSLLFRRPMARRQQLINVGIRQHASTPCPAIPNQLERRWRK